MYKKPKLLSEFIDICSKTRYFKAKAGEKYLKNITFFSHGQLLQKNIERELLHKGKDIENSLKTFGEKDFAENEQEMTLFEKYSLIRKRNRSTKMIPFGLIDVQQIQRKIQWHNNGLDDKEIDVEFNGGGTLMNCSYFVHDKQSREYFYRIQRQRKIWWMKFAANPGRFLISEVKSNEVNDHTVQSVSIKAAFPFGNLSIENISLSPIELVYPEVVAKNSKTKSQIPNKIIKTSTYLEIATIETVLDGIDAGDFGEMCVHRKMAPFQCSIYCLAEDQSTLNELAELAKYIAIILEKHNISILNPEKYLFLDKTALDNEFSEMDAIGIPYGLILETDSIKNGLLKLRNRDTTLSEIIHISYIPHYLLQIFQS